MMKLAIFDLDGTLLDTLEDLASAANYTLKELGCPQHPSEKYNIFCGKGVTNLFISALPEEHRNETIINKAVEIFKSHYKEHNACTKPYRGIPELLEWLQNNGFKIAVATNKYQDAAEKLVKYHFKNIDFVSVRGQKEGFPIKPDPAIIEQILSMDKDFNKNNVVYCGDSDVDMLTGINAGVKTIGVTWGFRTPEELEKYSPWFIATKPEEIADKLSQNESE